MANPTGLGRIHVGSQLQFHTLTARAGPGLGTELGQGDSG